MTALPISLILLTLLGPACSRETPEQRVGRLIERAESAAQDRDLATLGEMVSADYRDSRGQGKAELLAIVRYQFQQSRSVHIYKKVRSIRAVDAATVEAIVLVAVAARPVRDPRQLGEIPADLLRCDLRFAEEDGKRWRLVQAEWRRVQAIDFL